MCTKECKYCGDLITDRDAYHEWADKLADAIAEYFGADIGEHSNANLPWDNAYNLIPSENTDDLKEVLDFCNEIMTAKFMTPGVGSYNSDEFHTLERIINKIEGVKNKNGKS